MNAVAVPVDNREAEGSQNSAEGCQKPGLEPAIAAICSNIKQPRKRGNTSAHCSDRMAAAKLVLNVPCESCGSGVGIRCTSISGMDTYPHGIRVRTWRKAGGRLPL